MQTRKSEKGGVGTSLLISLSVIITVGFIYILPLVRVLRESFGTVGLLLIGGKP